MKKIQSDWCEKKQLYCTYGVYCACNCIGCQKGYGSKEVEPDLSVDVTIGDKSHNEPLELY